MLFHVSCFIILSINDWCMNVFVLFTDMEPTSGSISVNFVCTHFHFKMFMICDVSCVVSSDAIFSTKEELSWDNDKSVSRNTSNKYISTPKNDSYVESAYHTRMTKQRKKTKEKKIHTKNEHDTRNKRIYDRHTESSTTSATQYAMCIALCIELESYGLSWYVLLYNNDYYEEQNDSLKHSVHCLFVI